MGGQLNHNHNIHNSGRDQQTVRRTHLTRNNLRRTKKTTNKQSRQEQHQCQSSQQNKRSWNTTWHTHTHMPYRSWCPICIQGRGRSDAHPQRSSRPIIQIDFVFLKGIENQYPTPVPTAIDIETGLCSATLVPNKATMMDYCVNNIIAFIKEAAEHQQWFRVTTNNEPYLTALVIKGTRYFHQPFTSLQLTKSR